jgi:DHA1 family bicyclomycin/chloramphenicol resistance-like MFS transporter
VAFRFVMALGACSGLVASRAVIMDLFPMKEIASILSTFVLIIALSPLIAPSVGAYLALGPGWRTVFIILAAFVATLFFVVAFFLPESKGRDATVSLRPTKIGRRYLDVALNRQFLLYACASGISFAALFSYVASAPALLMAHFRLTNTQFGWTFTLIVAGLISGSQANRLLLKRYSPTAISKACVAGEAAIAIVLVALAASGRLSLPLALALIPAFLFCVGMVNPNTTSLALQPFAQKAGSASALVGAVQMAFGAVATAVISSFDSPSPLPLAITFLGCAVCGAALLAAAPKPEA